ncbi:MAG: cellulose binding domain-containing protein, partial [Planctomycetota bacterium]
MVVNDRGTPAATWRVEFDYKCDINNIWNGKIAFHGGSHYAIVPESYNSAIPVGGSVRFGFVGSGTAAERPSNVVVTWGDANPAVSVADSSIAEGDSGSKTLLATVSLSAASGSPVTVAYATQNGTATGGSDYVSAKGTIVFTPGETSRTVPIVVNGDSNEEPDETFSLTLSGVTGATLARPVATMTIRNDDAGVVPPGTLAAKGDLTVASDWGAGFTATVTLTNTGAKPIQGWTLAFDLPSAISNIWNASVVSRSGDRLTIRDASYNAAINPGASVSFGFNGSSGNLKTGPANWNLNGSPISSSFNGKADQPAPVNPPSPPSISILNASVIAGEPTSGVSPGYFRTAGNQIVDEKGQVVRLSGVNWFGMESPNFAPHGLWTRGYREMMDQMKQTGFNTIRQPISNQLFDAGSIPNGIDFSKNADLQGLNGLQILDRIVAYAGTIGLRIFLDHHRSDAGAGTEGSGLWYTPAYPESRFLSDWKMLATRYANNPTVIGADLHNEPHGPATWGDGNPATDWRMAA